MKRLLMAGLALLAVAAAPPRSKVFDPAVAIEESTDYVSAVAFSPDGSRLAIGYRRFEKKPFRRWGEIRLYNLKSGKREAIWEGHQDEPSALVFSPDGKMLVSATSSGERIHWDVAEGKAEYTHRQRLYSPVSRLDFRSDGKQVGMPTGREVVVWDSTGKEVRRLSLVLNGFGAGFSHDLRLLAAPNHQDVDLWDVGKGSIVCSLLDHPGRVNAVSFCGEDKRLAVACSRWTDDREPDSAIWLWDVASGRRKRVIPLGNMYCYHVALSPDGRHVAVTGAVPLHGPQELRLFDTSSGGELGRLRPSPAVRWLGPPTFTPDGRWLAAATDGRILRVWRTRPSALAKPAANKTGRLKLRIEEKGKPVPARVHLLDPAGKPVRADKLPFWRDHFVCAGEVELDLPIGTYRYEVERGPEHTRAAGRVEVNDKGATQVISLKRIIDCARLGWHSGDLHIHRPPADIPLLMRAEDLHIGGVITWWNNNTAWRDRKLPSPTVVSLDDGRFYDILGGEDERGGGALLYFNRKEPLALRGSAREYPASLAFLDQAKRDKKTWVDIEKPFWWDVPVWLASGKVDSIGIAHNHMHRGGVLDGEAWGKPRDRDRYAGPTGNGRWTQDIYYNLLNAGLRLPPSAGSASGVLPNPVGYNRVYVHTGKALVWDDWWAGLKAGKCFVTNGPLLFARAGGELSGHVFRSADEKDLEIDIDVIANDAIRTIEVVQDGEVVQAIHVGKTAWKGKSNKIHFRRSGWVLVRAMVDVKHTFRFASTAPWYVEIGKTPRPISKRAVQFFQSWVAERRQALVRALRDEKQRSEVLEYHDRAVKFWAERLKAADRP